MVRVVDKIPFSILGTRSALTTQEASHLRSGASDHLQLGHAEYENV